MHADSSRIRSHTECFFNLTQDLGFAENHRIETGGYSEDMPDCFYIVETIKMFGYVFVRNLVKVAQKFTNQAIVGTLCDDLNPVAGRENHRLAHVLATDQGSQSRTQHVTIEREPFPNFDGGCFVANSDQCELHH